MSSEVRGSVFPQVTGMIDSAAVRPDPPDWLHFPADQPARRPVAVIELTPKLEPVENLPIGTVIDNFCERERPRREH